MYHFIVNFPERIYKKEQLKGLVASDIEDEVFEQIKDQKGRTAWWLKSTIDGLFHLAEQIEADLNCLEEVLGYGLIDNNVIEDDLDPLLELFYKHKNGVLYKLVSNSLEDSISPDKLKNLPMYYFTK